VTFYPIFTGLIASMIHVISGPDYLAAVTPFAITSKKKAWKVGLFWGIGHILGMLSIGVLFLLFKEYIALELISEKSEFLVGLILVLLGIWVFYKLYKGEVKHSHIHVHHETNPIIHEHDHLHDGVENSGHGHKHPELKQSLISSLSIGFIHGLAGIAHFILLLPVLGFETRTGLPFGKRYGI
jgi:ABC-type nickel/cobalt efflux system permease component RcnA